MKLCESKIQKVYTVTHLSPFKSFLGPKDLTNLDLFSGEAAINRAFGATLNGEHRTCDSHICFGVYDSLQLQCSGVDNFA